MCRKSYWHARTLPKRHKIYQTYRCGYMVEEIQQQVRINLAPLKTTLHISFSNWVPRCEARWRLLLEKNPQFFCANFEGRVIKRTANWHTLGISRKEWSLANYLWICNAVKFSSVECVAEEHICHIHGAQRVWSVVKSKSSIPKWLEPHPATEWIVLSVARDAYPYPIRLVPIRHPGNSMPNS